MDNQLETISTIQYTGKKSSTTLAYHHYNPNQLLLGKTIEEHLRLAVSYWNTYCWSTHEDDYTEYKWGKNADPMQVARHRVHHAFEFIERLGLKYFTFQDYDIAPEGSTLRESQYNLNVIADSIQLEMQHKKIKLLSGSANLFDHKRYALGAATNPDPYIFSHAVSQVKQALDITHKLQGDCYVISTGCEGYETLLNTDLQQELNQLERFLVMLVEYKNKIGYKGTLLIEPKLFELNRQQYNYDIAKIIALLERNHLENEFKISIESNYGTLKSHTLAHEVAYTLANNMFGNINANLSTANQKWDNDLLPSHFSELVQVLYLILKNNGFTHGGIHFHNRSYRRSISMSDLIFGHISAIDTIARALKNAADLIESKKLETTIQSRYRAWQSPLGSDILQAKTSFERITNAMLANEFQTNDK